MAIAKLRFEKFVDKDGNEFYELKSYEGILEKAILPQEYLRSDIYFYLVPEHCYPIYVKYHNDEILHSYGTGCHLSKDEFNRLIATMKAAGKALTVINKKIRQKKDEWKGEFEVTI